MLRVCFGMYKRILIRLGALDLGLRGNRRTLSPMPKYDVYVVCDQCSQPHAVNVKLELDEGGLDRTPVADAFDGKPLPSVIKFMQTNKYRCPHTKQLFSAADIGDAILFESGI